MVSVNPATAELSAFDETAQLTAVVHDQHGQIMPRVVVNWASTDDRIATVSAAGLVTATGNGEAGITARAGSATGTASVTVAQRVHEVAVTPAVATLLMGESLRLRAAARDANGHEVVAAVFDWSSSDTSVARVDEGLVEGVAEGSATITAMAGSGSDSSEITVVNPDRLALAALYEATGGSGWNNARNWMTEAPLGTWAGVTMDGSRVSVLRLSRNNLRGTLPRQIGDLSALEELDLLGNRLTGALPPELGNLSNLKVLQLEGNAIQGAIPAEIGEISNLRTLALTGNGLAGRIPPELGNLARLEVLSVGRNRLSGSIPPELGNLANLIEATFWWNDLSGPIPPTLGRLKKLKSLHLAENRLTGPIPVEFGGLASIEKLIVRFNKLTGPIPQSLLQLADQLKSFQFQDNPDLCVPGTAGFIQWLGASRGVLCNRFDLIVLESLREATGGANWIRSDGWFETHATSEWYGVHADSLGRVTRLDLNGNGLKGRLPGTLGGLTQLKELRISGNALSGQLPLSLLELSLEALHYRDTELCAPSSTAFQSWLSTIPLHDGTDRSCDSSSERDVLLALWEATNGPRWSRRMHWLSVEPLGRWDGVETNEAGRVTALRLWLNRLAGVIPPELGELSELTILHLERNRLARSIPSTLGNLARLQDLRLSENQLMGSIPPELGALSGLESLSLSRNDLTGSVPEELGGLSVLTTLDLSENRLEGPIPGQLGQLRRLERLDVSRNDLSGSIPGDFGSLSSLTSLRLGENELSGSIPSSLGDLSNLEELIVSRNALSGEVPPELGRLANLRVLDLSNNARLAGVLPAELTSLGGLETFLTGGTNLCAPSTDRFLAWLEASNRRVARCAPVTAYLTQAIQSRAFPVPLVAGRDALLRVFVTSEHAAGEGIPPVRASFYVDGVEVHVADIPAPSAPIPTEINESDLRASSNATIPGSVLQPGLEVVIAVDPDGTLDPGLRVPKRVPETGRMEIDVRSVPTLDLTLVPFLRDQAPDATLLALIGEMVEDPQRHPGLWAVRTLLPVGEIDAKAHEPVVTSSTRVEDLLRETEAIRTMEGASGHFMGMIGGLTRGAAVLRGRVAVAGSDPVSMAHELAHNMSLEHWSCSVEDFLTLTYPEDGRIGAWGFDAREGGGLVAPTTWDLMGCVGPLQWIGEYNFTKATRFRVSDEDAADGAVAADPTRTLLLWGGIDEAGAPFLDPAFIVESAPKLPETGGDYEIKGRAADGGEMFTLRFDMPNVADGEGGSSFVFALPADPAWGGNLAEITLSGPGGTFRLDDETDLPMAILRAPGTGRVRGILRDVAASDLGQMAADGVALAAGLDVRFSRGIPDLADWDR